MLKSSALLISVYLMALSPGVVCGQDNPKRALRIVTTPAGGGNDFAARLIAQGLAASLGQPVIVDNRASPLVSIETVAKASPDGYSLLLGGAGVWLLPLLQKASYDVLRDFLPITLAVKEPSVVVVYPSVPAKSVQELIALAKARPGELNYASIGIGRTPHLAAELFKTMAGVNIVHISYKGSAAAVTDLIGGQVQMQIGSASSMAPHIKSGKLRALAVTSAEPSALVPGLPTVAASGVPGYEVVGPTCLWVPAKTPASIIDRLNQEIVRVLNRADIKERFLNAGAETVGSTPEQLATAMRSDISRMGKVIKEAGIRAD